MNCIICNKEFVTNHHNKKTCSKECQKKNNYLIKKKYERKLQEKTGLSYRQIHLKTCKENEKKFRNTPKGKIYLKNKKRRYYQSQKGRATLLRGAKKRELRKRNIRHNFSESSLLERLLKTDGRCDGCKKYFGVDNLTLDHIIPVSQAPTGYSYNIEDIQFLCKPCNSKRGNRVYIDSKIEASDEA